MGIPHEACRCGKDPSNIGYSYKYFEHFEAQLICIGYGAVFKTGNFKNVFRIQSPSAIFSTMLFYNFFSFLSFSLSVFISSFSLVLTLIEMTKNTISNCQILLKITINMWNNCVCLLCVHHLPIVMLKSKLREVLSI